MVIQSVLFDRNIWTLKKAKDWLKWRGMFQFVDVKPNFWRFRQEDPSKFKTLKIKKIGNGIEFVLGYND